MTSPSGFVGLLVLERCRRACNWRRRRSSRVQIALALFLGRTSSRSAGCRRRRRRRLGAGPSCLVDRPRPACRGLLVERAREVLASRHGAVVVTSRLSGLSRSLTTVFDLRLGLWRTPRSVSARLRARAGSAVTPPRRRRPGPPPGCLRMHESSRCEGMVLIRPRHSRPDVPSTWDGGPGPPGRRGTSSALVRESSSYAARIRSAASVAGSSPESTASRTSSRIAFTPAECRSRWSSSSRTSAQVKSSCCCGALGGQPVGAEVLAVREDPAPRRRRRRCPRAPSR